MEDRQSVLGRELIPVESVFKLMFLMLRNDITQGSFVMESVRLTVKDINMWSEMGSSAAVQARGVTPEQQTKSRTCPFE